LTAVVNIRLQGGRRSGPMMYPDDAQMFHGPMFRALKQLFLQRDGG
jgi:hypothetical protein